MSSASNMSSASKFLLRVLSINNSLLLVIESDQSFNKNIGRNFYYTLLLLEKI